MRALRNRLTYANVVATLALVIAVVGGTAYAANTVFSSDIVDDQVRSVDVRNDTLSGGGLTAADLRAGAVGTSEVLDDTATGGGLAAADLRSGSVGSAEVAKSSLRGADIAESTLGQVPDADKLDSLDSTQLNPVTGDGRIADFPLNNGNQTVLTATITTARSAALDVSATVDVANTQTNTGGVTCYFQFDGISTFSPEFTTYAESLKETLPLVWVQGVAAGTHTVDLRCRGATYLYVDNAGMSVSAHL